MLAQIDINCDMGEAVADNHDERFMPFISSCNISCGAHAGTPDVIAKTVEAAVGHGLAIGAHPSYPDPEHFGRRSMDIADADLASAIGDQIRYLTGVVTAFGGSIAYVKPHGALYNDMVRIPGRAETVIDAILAAGGPAAIYGLANSLVARVAFSRHVRFIHEAFADRRYEADLTLTPRSRPRAVIESEPAVIAQVDGFVQKQTVVTTDGEEKPLPVESICVHSDTPGALTLAHRIFEYLQEHDVRIRSPL